MNQVQIEKALAGYPIFESRDAAEQWFTEQSKIALCRRCVWIKTAASYEKWRMNPGGARVRVRVIPLIGGEV